MSMYSFYHQIRWYTEHCEDYWSYLGVSQCTSLTGAPLKSTNSNNRREKMLNPRLIGLSLANEIKMNWRMWN